MRKFARIKTKLISCILLLAMSALFLASANHVQADQEYLSFDQYKAEHYINYSSYEYFMSDDFKMPYRTTVEKDRSSATFNSLLAAWEVATFSGSNVVEMANKRKGYYEAFLFDIIYTGTDAVNVTDAMNAGIKATQASVLSKVTKLMDEGYYKDIDVRKLTEESYAKLVSGLESCGEFNDIFSAVNNVGKYVQYANDIETLVYRMAKIEAICGQSKEYAEVLRDMSKNTTDETLAAACDEMASICDGVMNAKLMDAIMTGEEVVTNVSKWVTDKIWDYVIDSLGACGIGVTAGQAVGKWASGLLFSTDKTIETYYEMSALYNFDNAIRKVVKNYEQQYSRYSSDSVEYAKKFNASVELMLKTQELGCDISIKDAEYKYEKGIANVFVSRFNGKKEAMVSYKKSLQGIKKNISFIYTFANGDLYNCYKDEYCSNVSEDLGMTDVATTDDGSSASKADEKQVTQELIRTAEACCKKEIKEPMKLTGNATYYGDVYVSSDLNLNGYKCTVYGNLIQSSGTLTLNGGTLDVSGDYRMENENVDSTGNVSYSNGSAKLIMTNSADRVNVGGTFENYVDSWTYDSDLQAGVMNVKGDFVCRDDDGFSTGGTHKVILNGTGVQKVQIAGGGKGFNELDIQNDKVVFVADTNMKGFKANHDITLNVSQGKTLQISGTLDLNGHTLYAPGNLTLTGNGVNVKGGSIVVDGNLNLSCDVNLGGGKLQVKGNLIQSSHTLTVAGGTVDVSRDYRMEHENVDSTGNVSYSNGSAKLIMTNSADRVNVGGTFENYVDSWTYDSDLQAGVMNVKGDFVCRDDDGFSTGGTHKVILNGTGVQKVQIAGGGKGFNELDIQNDKVVFVADTNMKGFKANHDITLNVSQGKTLQISGTLDLNGHTLYAPGNLTLTGNGVNVKGGSIVVDGNLNLSCDVNLGGGKLQVKGNLIQSSHTLTVAGGTVDVSRDYRMEHENVDSTGNVSYSNGSAKLIMTNSADRVNVGGTFENYVDSWTYDSDLQAGVMNVKGDFVCRDDDGFSTGGTHKVILNGTGVQKVQIAGGGKGFNELDIQNDKVVFVADTNMKGFKANHDITLNVSQGKTLQISGTLDLNGHTLYAPGNLTLTGNGVNVKGGSIVVDGNLNLSCDVNLGGGKLQVKGNLIQSSDTLTVAGGTVDVSGDYRMENENVDSTGNVSYSDCSAELNMTNANDCVNVGGTFEFDASNGDLTDGIICVKRDLIIKDSSYSDRFDPTGNHTIKLDGDKVQKIQVEGTYNKINNLYLTKDKSTGYNFVTDNCWNKLYLKTKVDNVTVSPDLKDVCQGEQIQYSAQVSGVNSPSQAVTWSVTGAKSADTHIDEKGLLSVAKDEAASNIVIKAVSAEDSSKTASQTVNITKRVPRVDAVRLSANTASMCPGDTHKFSAAVLGENDISQEVVWSVTGQQSADTKVAEDGTLTVGKDESADNISVVATSAVNNKVSASVKIQIVHVIIDSGVDQVAIVVKCGGSLSFEAHIVGINLSSDAVTWSVSNNTSKATSISQEGVLTVGEDEKAATLIVTATSVADPTKSASVNVKVEGSDNTKVVGYSVGLSDMISLNMYTYVPEKFLSDTGATAVFTLADGTVTQQPLSEFKKASYNGANTVVINTKMVPAYITRSVTMKIVGSDGKESEGFTYSIYEYAKDYIKYATTETEYQKALPLVKAMLDYGAYSQLFFGVDASNLANYDRVSNLKLTEGNVEQTSCDSVFSAITNEETGTLGNEELIYQNISLICESETSMKLYFQNKNNLTLDQIKEKYAIKVYDSEGNVIPDDGCEMQVEGEQFWIKIKNLGPVNLSSDYTIEFTSDAGTQRGTVSPICYIKKAMKQDDMNLQNLCKAMYLYNKATLEYIGQ